MPLPTRRRPRRRLPDLDALERRDVPAAAGAPWTDAARLTLSFAPDGTVVAGRPSVLFEALDAGQPTATWQREVLRAFQAWALVANVNIGLVHDGGQPLGVAGRAQHDDRFGDIRVAAQSMAADVLSVSVPFDPALTGSLAGDLLLNSDAPIAAADGSLLAVALHEVGHVLGLSHSDDPASVMASHLNANTTLAPGDVAAIRALYGARAPDPHEGSDGNTTPASATELPLPDARGGTPIVTFGDVSAASDVDVYAVRTPAGYAGSVTIRLRSRGLSLLAPRVAVRDASGAVLAEARAATPGFGDDLSLIVPAPAPGDPFYVSVDGSPGEAFQVGAYGLAVTFDEASSVPAANVDRVLLEYEPTLDEGDLAALVRDPSGALIRRDHRADDDLAGALRLASSPGYAQDAHYRVVGSIEDPSDVDHYRIRAAHDGSGRPIVLTASASMLGVGGQAPRVTLLDGDTNPVAFQVLANGDGTYTIQAGGLKDGGNYYLRVEHLDGAAPAGNYALEVDFGHDTSGIRSEAEGTLTPDAPARGFDFFVARSGLFQFLLASGAADSSPALALSIVDASGQVRMTRSARPGETAGGAAAFLTPGAYRIVVLADGPLAAGAALPFLVLGKQLSDPIGPQLQDPTLRPVYTTPSMPGVFTYPNGTTSSEPYLIALATPPPPPPPAVVSPPLAGNPGPVSPTPPPVHARPVRHVEHRRRRKPKGHRPAAKVRWPATPRPRRARPSPI